MTADSLRNFAPANETSGQQLPAGAALLQNPYTLALGNVPEAQIRLRTGGLYWLVIDRAADADSLALQLLGAMEVAQRAALITAARSPRELVQSLNPATGPGELRLLSLNTARPAQAIAALRTDLERAIRPRRRLLVLIAASANWQSMDDAVLKNWLVRWLPWLEARQCTLLILSHGDAGVPLTARLLVHNPYLSGLGRMHRRSSQMHFLLQYWRNTLGVSGASELILNEDATGFHLHEVRPGQIHHGSDEDLYLAQKEALEGAPVLSERWQLATDAEELFTRALHAQAATLVFCIGHTGQFDALARMIHRLRTQCGMALKIVVREMAPSLRRHDEQALIACGTNLVVPAGTPLPRFLVMLESVQGQILERPIVADIEPLLRSNQSLRLRGPVTPEQFVDYLETVVKNSLNNDPPGVLVALEPVPGLKAVQALTQSQLRRYGDVVCELNNQLYLFLFGCELGSVETALANIFSLPYQDLFLSHAAFVTVEQILAQAQWLRDRRHGNADSAQEVRRSISITPAEAASPPSPLKQRPAALAPTPRKLSLMQGASSQ